MSKFLFAALLILTVSTDTAFADPRDPHTVAGKCAKANGGYYIAATQRWRTDNIGAWRSCMKSAGVSVSTEPHTIAGKCSKANGGHHVPGTPHQWQTYNIDAWNRCINDHALAEQRAMHV
jgi:hypothetical protein